MLSNFKDAYTSSPLCISVLQLVQHHSLLCFSAKTEGSVYDHPKPFSKIDSLSLVVQNFLCVALIGRACFFPTEYCICSANATCIDIATHASKYGQTATFLLLSPTLSSPLSFLRVFMSGSQRCETMQNR